MIDSKYDVIVIGGGPAGSTAAALLSEHGHDVLLLERDTFPRFKIGESLMPGTYHTFQRLGVLDKLKRSAFPNKYSIQFYSRTGKANRPFYFQDNDPHESSVTWQVLRSEFDQMMIENAERMGATVKQGVAVTDVHFDGDRATGVCARLEDGTEQDIHSSVLVDATGQSALLARKLGIKSEEPCLKNASIFTHFKNAKRDEGTDAGATIIFHTKEQNSWFWFIPLPDNVTSVGVVGPIDYLIKNREGTMQEIFAEELAICPALQPRLQHAEQLFPVKTTKDFSYRADRIAGEGWVLIGDAFGFIDPIYSSGVFLALKSGEMAADSIHQALERNDLTAPALGSFGPKFVEGLEAIRKLVYAYYTKDFSFSHFLKQYPACEKQLINLLIGNVFREGFNGIFDSMKEMVKLPDEQPLSTNGSPN